MPFCGCFPRKHMDWPSPAAGSLRIGSHRIFKTWISMALRLSLFRGCATTCSHNRDTLPLSIPCVSVLHVSLLVSSRIYRPSACVCTTTHEGWSWMQWLLHGSLVGFLALGACFWTPVPLRVDLESDQLDG